MCVEREERRGERELLESLGYLKISATSAINGYNYFTLPATSNITKHP